MKVAQSARTSIQIFGEAWATLSHRPGSTLLSTAASALGVAVLVATIGVTQTMSLQVSEQFDAVRSTQVLVRSSEGAQEAIPIEAEMRVRDIVGVTSAGLIVRRGPRAVRATTLDSVATGIEVIAATPSALEVLQIELAAGRLFDSFHQGESPDVALVGSEVADRLNLARPDGTATVTIAGRRHLLLGTFAEVGRRPALSGAIIVPLREADRQPSEANLEELLIETETGAARIVARQAAVAINPSRPDEIIADAPPDPVTFRHALEDSLKRSLVMTGGVVFVVGLLSIANASFVSVLERTQEIGVRRALGARPIHIWIQVVAEAAGTGMLGGIVGSSIATMAVVVIAAVQDWTPSLPLLVPMAGPALGALAGGVAGTIPARRATRIQPTVALRH